MKQNRLHQRVKPHAQGPIEVQIIGDGFMEVLRAKDISADGVGVFVPHDFAGCDLKAEVQVVVKLPMQKAFMTKGTIRHISNRGTDAHLFGVQFTTVTANDRERLKMYIEKRVAEGGAT